MGKPDFSGVWRFNPKRSSLQIPAPDSSVFVIEHHEPRLHFERTHTYAAGSDLFTIDLTTDDRPVELSHGGLTIRSRMYWEDDTLVFHSDLRQGDVQGTNIVRYRLVDGGHTIVALERLDFPGHTHENTWVLEKQ